MRYCSFLVLVSFLCADGAPAEEAQVPQRNDTKDLAEDGDYDGGDLKLTAKQKQALYGGRAAFTAYRWANFWQDAIVPYTIRESDFDSSQVSEIKEAMKRWEDDTCVRFRPRSIEPDYLAIQDGKEGCNSYLGNVHKGGQPLNLRNSGCMVMGTYLHEIGHALGLIHEHQRPDREKYIHVYENRVDPDRMSNMEAYKSRLVDYRGVDFDMSSIMLYSLEAFSRAAGLPTIGVENTFYHDHINGRRYRHLLSFGDLKKVNSMYKCANRCKKAVDCPEPGFVNERCECVTLENYLAKRCKNNPEYEEWCDERALYGYCDRKDAYQQRHCMKSCDFCPIFAPGTSGRVKPQGCVNHYSDDKKCDYWAGKGWCTYPWLRRYCRKSCDASKKTCSEKVGICANKLETDDECEDYATHWLYDYCGSPKYWGERARAECPDSCKSCPK